VEKGIGDVEYFLVIAGLDPAIHLRKMMDARGKPAHDAGTLLWASMMIKVTKLKCLGDHRLHAERWNGGRVRFLRASRRNWPDDRALARSRILRARIP
jgi:hypothetical protein